MLHTFKGFPRISERAAWQSAIGLEQNRELGEKILAYAESLLGKPVPVLTASAFMEFVRNGNRINYEIPYFERRRNLEALVLAEGIEYQGRFIDTIIEYIWALLGEPTWCVPAHTRSCFLPYVEIDPLPTNEHEVVDLFAAETGCLLAETLALMDQELNGVSKNLVIRVRNEVRRRVLVPGEKYLNHFTWGHGIYNWTPWICSNMLWSANYVYSGDEEKSFDRLANALLKSVMHYYEAYKEDGGCVEGPGYWQLSPPRFFLFMEGIYRGSDGAISVFGDEKFKNMCSYPAKAWYENGRYARFADCGGRHSCYSGLIRAMGQRIGSEELLAFADDSDKYRNEFPKSHSPLLPSLFDIFGKTGEKAAPVEKSFHVYPVLQQVFSKANGHFIAIKGGCNCESHSHNDTGQFVLGKDGKFLALDLGSGVYDKDSFNENRYKKYPQSGFSHNPLVFDGVPEQCLANARTSMFEASGDADAFTCRMEISKCFPREVGLLSYYRSFTLKDNVFTVVDEWKAKRSVKPTMTLLHEVKVLKLKCSAPFTTEVLALEDKSLVAAWGKRIYRSLVDVPPAKEGKLTLSFKL